MTACRSVETAGRSSLLSSQRSDRALTRSTTRPSREDVDRIMLPHADISTAGVIMAVKTAIAELESIAKVSVAASFIETNQAKGNWPTIHVLSCRFQGSDKPTNPQVTQIPQIKNQEQRQKPIIVHISFDISHLSLVMKTSC